MTRSTLTDLLNDVADAAPDVDLVPGTLRDVRRTRVLQGVLAAAISVPMVAVVASLVLAGQPTIRALPAPLATSTDAPSPTPTTAPTGTPTPTPTSSPTSRGTTSAVESPRPTAGPPKAADDAYEIPGNIGFKRAEIPQEFQPLQSFDAEGTQSRQVTPAFGLVCDPGTPGAPTPISARDWSYTAPMRGSADDGWLELVVSGWDDGAVAFDQIKHNKGTCVASSFRLLSATEDSLEIHAKWIGTKVDDVVIEVRRLNNVLVAVSYFPKKGQSALDHVATARNLADLALHRAQAAGLENR